MTVKRKTCIRGRRGSVKIILGTRRPPLPGRGQGYEVFPDPFHPSFTVETGWSLYVIHESVKPNIVVTTSILKSEPFTPEKSGKERGNTLHNLNRPAPFKGRRFRKLIEGQRILPLPKIPDPSFLVTDPPGSVIPKPPNLIGVPSETKRKGNNIILYVF